MIRLTAYRLFSNDFVFGLFLLYGTAETTALWGT